MTGGWLPFDTKQRDHARVCPDLGEEGVRVELPQDFVAVRIDEGVAERTSLPTGDALIGVFGSLRVAGFLRRGEVGEVSVPDSVFFEKCLKSQAVGKGVLGASHHPSRAQVAECIDVGGLQRGEKRVSIKPYRADGDDFLHVSLTYSPNGRGWRDLPLITSRTT